MPDDELFEIAFQQTAARRRLALALIIEMADVMFQHTAARRRLGQSKIQTDYQHSFNTQPPEGGWPAFSALASASSLFQHTAARRRLGVFQTASKRMAAFQHTAARRRLDAVGGFPSGLFVLVSTHSRPKAAGHRKKVSSIIAQLVSTHSRLKAADRPDNPCCTLCGFNTQPPEGGCRQKGNIMSQENVSTHSRLKAADNPDYKIQKERLFQHTAA